MPYMYMWITTNQITVSSYMNELIVKTPTLSDLIRYAGLSNYLKGGRPTLLAVNRDKPAKVFVYGLGTYFWTGDDSGLPTGPITSSQILKNLVRCLIHS